MSLFKSKAHIKGKVTAIVFGPDGEIKRKPQTRLQKLLGLPGSRMISVNHNIVTDEGDALIADLMATTPARQKFDNSNAFIQVGTGFTSESKSATACTTSTGTPEAMDATYPVLKGSWGNTDDNVIQYRSTFEAGDLNATGIDEAAILNNVTPASADCLAYAQITPAIDVASSDTLQITWELTITGV